MALFDVCKRHCLVRYNFAQTFQFNSEVCSQSVVVSSSSTSKLLQHVMLWKTKWCSDNRLCEIDTTVQYAFWYAYILCIYVQPYIISVLSMCVTGNSTSGKFKRSKKHCRINSSLTVDAHWSVDLNWIRSEPEVIWKGIRFSGLTFPHSHTYHLLGRVYTKLTFESTGKSYANHMTLPVKPVLDHILTSIICRCVKAQGMVSANHHSSGFLLV